MCGIVGVFSRDAAFPRDMLLRMRDAMHHRGPDDAGVWWSPDGQLGLAQCRLAIIDLSPGGHQPMSDATGRLQIVFNGEIYNYQDLRRELETRGSTFRSASDTEVLLEAYRVWGTQCLDHLHGMFAFALYDAPARRLFLARDRAGEKPLFYHHTGQRFAFASELKALMADPAFPRRLDLEALDYYLTFGYVPGRLCILEGVHKLPPAHALTLDLETHALRVWRYWQIPDPQPSPQADAAELADRLEALLRDSVRRQLVADVPVGILLSGGLDSSLVTAIAAGLSSQPVNTFTVTFPGHRTHDEAPYARLVARHFGTHHTELVAEPATVELLPALARQYDEPLCDSSMVPTYLVSRLIRQHATVALGGDGGDELFGGYHRHQRSLSVAAVRRWLPAPVRDAVAHTASALLPLAFRGRKYFMSLGGTLSKASADISASFDPRARRRLFLPLRDGRLSPQDRPGAYFDEMWETERGLPGAVMALDFRNYLAEDILVKVDRVSMLVSLEVRAPFLDHRLIEFAFRDVPNELRATHRHRKILLRRVASRLLPKQFDVTRKWGFSLPIVSWLNGSWGPFVQDVLRQAEPRLFDQQEVQRLLDVQRRGLSNAEHATRVYLLTMFELWRREYQVGLP